jgi:signal recognition particle subunit SRP68
MATKAEKLAAKNELQARTFSLEILSKIKSNQMQHGIRHGDYNRYSQYCTKRMHRIRKKLKFHHGARFKKKSILPETVIDVRFLELVLLFSERAWAESMSLKEVDQSVNPRAKHHASRRLAKSSKWAKHLVLLCNAKGDPRTVLEAESYSAWLWGNVLLENEQWGEALENLVKAKTVYVELGKIGSPDQQLLCQERVEEIEPTIRYCKFNISQEGGSIDTESLVKMKSETESNQSLDLLKSKLDTVLNDARKHQAKSMKEILWKGERLPIKNEALRILIVKANDIISELHSMKSGEKKRELYASISIQYNDALKLVHTDMKKPQEGKTLLYLEQFLNFSIVEQTFQRNLELANDLEGELTKADKKEALHIADEIVRAYELLIANITDMKETKEFDEQGTKEYAAQILSYKAIRCYYVGISYLKAEKWLEAIALFKRSESQIDTTLKHHDAVTNKDTKLIAKLEFIRNQAIGNCTLSHSQGLLKLMKEKEENTPLSNSSQSTSTTNESKGQKFLLNHQEEYTAFIGDNDRKLIQFPPNYEPISCKPLLLDIAVEHIKFPDLTERKVEQKKGFLSGWW